MLLNVALAGGILPRDASAMVEHMQPQLLTFRYFILSLSHYDSIGGEVISKPLCRHWFFFFFRTRLFASARYKRSLCNQTYALPGGGGQGGASAPPRGARAALARARHQGRRREATQAGRQRKRAVRRLRGAPTSALPRQ